VDEDKEEACSAIGIADILNEKVEVDAERGGMNGEAFDAETLKGHLSENFGVAKAMA
jgi:hypothetical protein